MLKVNWTKEEVLNVLALHADGVDQGVTPPGDAIEVIMYVEKMFYTKHIAEIRARRDAIKNMWTDDTGFLSFWFDHDRLIGHSLQDIISPGCYACLFGTVNHIRHSIKCTQDCEYCYYKVGGRLNISSIGNELYQFSTTDLSYTEDEAKMYLERQGHKYTAIGWLHREPLEELELLTKLMPFISKKGVHQYLYTNGVPADAVTIDILADCGLDEIRFNLQATDFDPKIMARMKYAGEKIPYVLVESPMYSKSFDNFNEYIERIIDANVKQINFAELQICDLSRLDYFVEQEGPVYKHRRGYVSPISSRDFVYDFIERAEREMWPIVINDCSNDTKYFRGAYPELHLGLNVYDSAFELPLKHVALLAQDVMEDGVTYEFF